MGSCAVQRKGPGLHVQSPGVGLGESCGGGVVVASPEFEVSGGGVGVAGGVSPGVSGGEAKRRQSRNERGRSNLFRNKTLGR